MAHQLLDRIGALILRDSKRFNESFRSDSSFGKELGREPISARQSDQDVRRADTFIAFFREIFGLTPQGSDIARRSATPRLRS